LCAVRLLTRHHGVDSQPLLIELARHPEPAVAAAALHRLNEIDSALVVPLAEFALQNSDPNVRTEGVSAYLKLPALERIPRLAQLLGDADPGIRREVCDGLFQLAVKQELIEAIRDAVMQVLAGDRWQGQEQAALLLGALAHKPAANRLV